MLINCKNTLSDWNETGSCLHACQTKISNVLGQRNTLEFCYSITCYKLEFRIQVHPGCRPNWSCYGRFMGSLLWTYQTSNLVTKIVLTSLAPTQAHFGQCGSTKISRPGRWGKAVFQSRLPTHYLFSLYKHWLLAFNFPKDIEMSSSHCFLHYWTIHLLRNKCFYTSGLPSKMWGGLLCKTFL